MHRLRISEDTLKLRGPNFRILLGPLLKNPKQGGPSATRRFIGDHRLVWVAHQGNITNLNYSEWRFNIFLGGYKARYFEIWAPVDLATQNEWYLEKAYLTIYHGDTEYICLHCDPETENKASQRACYKQSPHLHISTAPQPLPKAHIALAHGRINEIFASETDLFKAMRLGVELIREEILALLNDKS